MLQTPEQNVHLHSKYINTYVAIKDHIYVFRVGLNDRAGGRGRATVGGAAVEVGVAKSR